MLRRNKYSFYLLQQSHVAAARILLIHPRVMSLRIQLVVLRAANHFRLLVLQEELKLIVNREQIVFRPRFLRIETGDLSGLVCSFGRDSQLHEHRYLWLGQVEVMSEVQILYVGHLGHRQPLRQRYLQETSKRRPRL